jgi:hypothetical protein
MPLKLITHDDNEKVTVILKKSIRNERAKSGVIRQDRISIGSSLKNKSNYHIYNSSQLQSQSRSKGHFELKTNSQATRMKASILREQEEQHSNHEN